jgi:hypothetical protein
VKYIHGDYGKGSFTYLGGHDPEDPQHNHRECADGPGVQSDVTGVSPDLNNVLFPAAKKKPLKT